MYHRTRELVYTPVRIAFLAQMDVAMLGPSSPERGSKIAKLCGDLEIANDIAMRFGLDLQRKGVKLTKINRKVKHRVIQNIPEQERK